MTDNEQREDIRAARLMALLANCLASRKDRKPFTPDDFMPNVKPKEQKPIEDQRAVPMTDDQKMLAVLTGKTVEVLWGYQAYDRNERYPHLSEFVQRVDDLIQTTLRRAFEPQ